MTPLFAILLLLNAEPAEKLPAGAVVERLECVPPVVELSGKFSYGQMLVNAVLASGETIDATRMVEWKSPSCAKVGPTGQVVPAGDHVFVMGEVVEMEHAHADLDPNPLLFFKGKVGKFHLPS